MKMMSAEQQNIQELEEKNMAGSQAEDFSEEEVSLNASAEELQVEDNEYLDSENAVSADYHVFDAMDRAQMLDHFAKLLDSTPIQELRSVAETLKVVFYRSLRAEIEAQRLAFVEAGNDPEAFVAPEDALELRLKELFARYKQQRLQHTQTIEQERQNNLQKKLAIIEELKSLFARQDDFNTIYNDFKHLQTRWREIGLVPQSEQNNIWKTYNHNIESFYDIVKINQELRELDFKRNLEIKYKLCQQAEDLLLEENVVDAFKKLQKYHEEWREVGPVAQEFRESVWDRFKEATSQINKKYQAYFEQQKEEQKKNLELKHELCERAEELLATPLTSAKEWNKKMDELVELQKVWKTIGFAPKKENVVIFQRFRTACNAFFDNRRAFFKEVKTEFNNNLQLKLELCEKAESLTQSDDWKKTTDELIELQKHWKTIGPVSRKYSDQVWKRFRAACDAFFDKKKSHFSEQDAKYDNNLKAKQSLIEEIKAYKASENPAENLGAIKEFQQRWVEIGYVPLKVKEHIQTEYRKVIDELFKSLRVNESERQLLLFKTKLEGNVDKGDKRKVSLERDKLIQQVKRLENDITVWENNIGFFAKSKNAEKMIADVQRNIQKAQTEIKMIEEKIKLIESSFNA